MNSRRLALVFLLVAAWIRAAEAPPSPPRNNPPGGTAAHQAEVDDLKAKREAMLKKRAEILARAKAAQTEEERAAILVEWIRAQADMKPAVDAAQSKVKAAAETARRQANPAKTTAPSEATRE